MIHEWGRMLNNIWSCSSSTPCDPNPNTSRVGRIGHLIPGVGVCLDLAWTRFDKPPLLHDRKWEYPLDKLAESAPFFIYHIIQCLQCIPSIVQHSKLYSLKLSLHNSSHLEQNTKFPIGIYIKEQAQCQGLELEYPTVETNTATNEQVQKQGQVLLYKMQH